MMASSITKPIFIVGCGRSGTTLFSLLLAGHHDLTWFSNYTQRFPSFPWLARLHNLYQQPALPYSWKRRHWFPKPAEGHALWDRFHPFVNSAGSPPLTENDATDADTAGLYRFIKNLLRFAGRERFMNKNTRNSRRMRYLYALFPDAFFIHIIRDGRAVSNSFLKVPWWPNLPLWWASGQTPRQMETAGYDPVLIPARMWKLNVERIWADAEHLPSNHYLEVRYEDLIANPLQQMKRVLDFCSLSWSSQFEAHIRTVPVRNQNFQWKQYFTPQQIAKIEAEIGAFLGELAYL